MAAITINGVEYDTDNLNEETINSLASLQFVKNEQLRLQAQIAVYKTAEASYAKAVENGL